MKTLKEYWFLIVFVLGLLGSGAVWIATINSKTFDDTEQKVKVVTTIEEMPSPEQQQRAYLLDSIDKADAIKTRKIRLETELRRDSIRGVQDSIILDIVRRNADQIFQLKQAIEHDVQD